MMIFEYRVTYVKRDDDASCVVRWQLDFSAKEAVVV